MTFRFSKNPVFSDLLAAIAVGLAGFLVNLFPLTLFPGVHLLFGATLTFYLAARKGFRAGAIAGLISASRTWWLWSQAFPLGAILIACESAWAGYFTGGKRKWRLLHSVLSYWLLIGIWLNLLGQHYLFKLSWQFAVTVSLRSVVNGLLCSLAAEVLLIVYSSWRKTKKDEKGGLHMSLSSVISLMLMLSVTATLVIALVLEIRQERERQLSEAEKEVSAGCQAVQRAIIGRTEMYRRSIAVIANLMQEQDVNLSDTKHLNQLLEATKREQPELAGMYIADANARTVAFSPATNTKGENLVGLDYSDRDYYKQIVSTKKTVFSGVYQARGGMDTPTAAIAVPFFDSKGNLKGFVIGWFDMNYFHQVVERIAADYKDVNILVADQNKQLVTDSKIPAAKYKLVQNVSTEPVIQLAQKSESGELILPDTTFSNSASTPHDVFSDNMWLKWNTVKDSGWKVIASRSMHPVEDNIAAYYFASLVIMFGLLVLSAIIAYLVGRKFAHPIASLEKYAQRLEIGDYNAATENEHVLISEVNSLTKSFENMATAIQRDIYRREQVQEALSASEERYRVLFNSNPEPMCVYDLETLKFLTVNEAAVRVYGYSHKEFLSLGIKDILAQEDSKRLKNIFITKDT